MDVRRLSAAFLRLLPPVLADKWRTVWYRKTKKMSIQITGKKSRNKQKKWYTFEWGKSPDQRKAAGICQYTANLGNSGESGALAEGLSDI